MERSGQLGLAPDRGEQRGSFEESPKHTLCLLTIPYIHYYSIQKLKREFCFLALLGGCVEEKFCVYVCT